MEVLNTRGSETIVYVEVEDEKSRADVKVPSHLIQIRSPKTERYAAKMRCKPPITPFAIQCF